MVFRGCKGYYNNLRFDCQISSERFNGTFTKRVYTIEKACFPSTPMVDIVGVRSPRPYNDSSRLKRRTPRLRVPT